MNIRKMTIMIWDVAHGNSCHIKTPDDETIVIDLGTGTHRSENEFSPLLYSKNLYKLSKIDRLIITHPHRDHIDDISNLDEFEINYVHAPFWLSIDDIKNGNRIIDNGKIDKYISFISRLKSVLSNGLSLNNELKINFFDSRNCPTSNLNNHSIVTTINFYGFKMVIPGDNEPPSWDCLLLNNDFKSAIQNCHVFMASHHGRKSGFSADIMDLANPNLTIISDGKRVKTSATADYSNKSSGDDVYSKARQKIDERKTLTTRKDGWIRIEVEYNLIDKKCTYLITTQN